MAEAAIGRRMLGEIEETSLDEVCQFVPLQPFSRHVHRSVPSEHTGEPATTAWLLRWRGLQISRSSLLSGNLQKLIADKPPPPD